MLGASCFFCFVLCSLCAFVSLCFLLVFVFLCIRALCFLFVSVVPVDLLGLFDFWFVCFPFALLYFCDWRFFVFLFCVVLCILCVILFFVFFVLLFCSFVLCVFGSFFLRGMLLCWYLCLLCSLII